VRLPDRKAFLDPKLGAGFSRTLDGCLTFAHEVSSAEALSAMRLPDESVYQRMVMLRPDHSVEIGEVGRELGFPDGASVSVGREKVSWQLPGQEAQESKYQDVAAALPVKAGDDYYIALAAHANGTERALSWCHPASKTFERFDVTGAITGLYAGDAVYAVGSNGAVLMMEPAMSEGQHVEARVKLPRSLSEPAPEGGRIVRDGDTVVVGGIVLKRRPQGGSDR